MLKGVQLSDDTLERLIPQGSTPEALGELLVADTKRWSSVITRAKIEKQ